MNDLNERLERRGAADENIWKWCKNVLKISEKYGHRQVSFVVSCETEQLKIFIIVPGNVECGECMLI